MPLGRHPPGGAEVASAHGGQYRKSVPMPLSWQFKASAMAHNDLLAGRRHGPASPVPSRSTDNLATMQTCGAAR